MSYSPIKFLFFLNFFQHILLLLYVCKQGKKVYDPKPSANRFNVKTKKLVDFHICITVPFMVFKNKSSKQAVRKIDIKSRYQKTM